MCKTFEGGTYLDKFLLLSIKVPSTLEMESDSRGEVGCGLSWETSVLFRVFNVESFLVALV